MKNVLKICLWVILGIGALAVAGLLVYNYARATYDKPSHPEVSFEVKDYGTVKMELYPEYAPNTVANIIKLVEKGYYNDKVVYGKDEICLYVGRDSQGEAVNPKKSLIDDSIEADSDNDFEFSIKGEFVANDYNKNTLRHEKGVVTLLRNDYSQYMSSLSEESYNSGNAQLAVMMDDASNLNGVYAAFGRIIEGMDVLEKIYNEVEIAESEDANAGEGLEEANAEGTETVEAESEEASEESGGIQAFKNYPVITSASVDTKGVDYGMPEVEEAFDYETYMNNMMQQYYGG